MLVHDLDNIDKQILNDIQWTFPLVDRPFLDLAKKYDISEDQVIDRIKKLKQIGIIRQISAIFDTRKLGYKSALVAFAVDKNKIESVANEINKHPGVSHNYERNHEYNLWFTLAVPPYGDMKADLEKMASLDGVLKYRVLPTLKMYKIGVKLDMVNDDPEKPTPNDEVKNMGIKAETISEIDREYIRQLQKDIEIVKEPFKTITENLEITSTDLFERVKEYEKIGIMRRFAAILRHRQAGFTANGMIVWKIPEEKIDEKGLKIASFPQVSHCYRRPIYPDWEFNLFSMIHARTMEAAEKIAKEISSVIGIENYRILFSSREFKKERVRYFE
ncbi:MAG TPA: Lrp/AsnC family transcriptional regulator [Candidatus Nitrosocosmicus sp.]|nr:Lrp/AsnC family transcriptional regulator [Candidatus Nitrosocosmicus sp.]